MALAAAAVAARRPRWLAVTVVAGAAFYPVTGVVLGLTLALYCCVWPGVGPATSGRRDWVKGCGLTLGTAVICLGVLSTSIAGSNRYGGRIHPDQYAEYPEAGPGGRSDSVGSADGPVFPVALMRSVEDNLWRAGVREPWKGPAAIVVTILTVAAGALVIARRPASRPLLCLVAAGAIGYHASIAAFPYLFWPDRYVSQVTWVVVTIIAAVGIVELVAWIRSTDADDRVTRRWAAAIALPPLFALALLPGKPSGLRLCVHGGQAFFDFVASLPPDALLAGWPKGRLESIRLVCGRKVFADHENYLVFHRGYVDLMRPRMALSIEAALSDRDEALRRLRTEYGVTHFVVRRRFGEQGPQCFKPFDGLIRKTLADRGDRPSAAAVLAEDAAVYRDRWYAVIDLENLESGGSSESP